MNTGDYRAAGLVLALLTVLAFAPAARAEPFRDVENHWSFEPPAGWQPVAQVYMDMTNAEAEARMPGKNFSYIHGWTADPTGQLTYPYILIQKTTANMRGQTYKDIAKALNGKVFDESVSKASEAMKDIGRLNGMGTPTVDPKRNLMWFEMRMDVEGIGSIKGKCVSFFGKDGMIQINGYAPEESYETFLPVFERSLASFAFEPGRQFTEKSRSNGAAVGGAVGAMTAVLLAARRKKKKAAEAAANEAAPGGAG